MDLRKEIFDMTIIDGHVHAADQYYWMKAVGSYPFTMLTDKLPMPGPYTTISRKKALVKCWKDIYDFPYDEVTEENYKILDDVYQPSRQDEGKFAMKAMDKAKIQGGVQMCMSGPEVSPGLDAKRFVKAQLIDGFLIPLDNTDVGSTPQEKMFLGMCTYYPGIKLKEMPPKNFDDYLKVIDKTLEDLTQKEDCHILKMNFSYWRDIEIDVISKEDAAEVYEKKDTAPKRYKMLQDYLLRHIIAKAATLDMICHIHAGPTMVLKGMETTSPARFDPFLFLPDIKPAKIVLLHGCYPYCREVGFMVARTGNVPNLYLDISLIPYWHLGAPEIMVNQLREWILAGFIDKMIYGSDSPSVWGIMMAADNTREALYQALQGLVNEGVYTYDQALKIAQRVMYGNAKDLYKWQF